MSSKESREFLREFILLYRSYPCLWQTKHDSYKDKKSRSIANDALVKKLREIYVNADRDMVARKINILRTSFRREYKKVRSTAWKHPKDRYKSPLWCYQLMKFVVEQNEQQTRSGNREVDVNDEVKWELTEPVEYQEEIAEEMGLTDDIEKIDHAASSEPIFHSVFLEVNDSYDSFSEAKNQQYRNAQDPCLPSKNVEHACEIPPRENCTAHNDDFQIFASYVAAKLRRSTARQSMIAERIIADVLLKANLGVLTENTSLREAPSQRFL